LFFFHDAQARLVTDEEEEEEEEGQQTCPTSDAITGG
jgi:hypothetical protein